MNKTMNEDLYTRIENPVFTRKQLLETSKLVVLLLQKFELFKEKRKRRQELLEQLKVTLKETHDLLDKLKKEMPQTKIRVKSQMPSKIEKMQKISKIQKIKNSGKEDSEEGEENQNAVNPKNETLDEIENALKDLELKLKALS